MIFNKSFIFIFVIILFMKREKVIIRTSFIGIIGNILLVVIKAIIGFISSSISIISDAINNLTDAISSLVTIIGTKLSNKRPNREHPFGYGRIEYVTSSIIGLIIFVAGALALYESIQALINKDVSDYSPISLITISIAILFKIGLGLFFKITGKKVNSDALNASGLDALLDAILSTGTLIAAIISFFTKVNIEGYIGIIIGLFIIKSSISILKEGVSKIIGERSDSKLNSQIISEVSKVKEVHGVYDLILNNYGNDKYIGSLHVEVDDEMKAKDIQLLERDIAYLCYEKFNVIMTVGIYARSSDKNDKEIRNEINKIIKSYPEIIQSHGFYVDEKRKIISLDIIISFDKVDSDNTFNNFKKQIEELYPDYKINLVLDNDFSLPEIKNSQKK